MSETNSKEVYFSVIIPVYNVELYLEQCIESVLNQSCTDYEVILVNDGSTDKSGDICDWYAKQCPKVRVIHKKNGGSSSSRNVGLDAASGKYVLFLDSDDFYADLDVLQNLKRSTQDSHYDFVLFKMAKYYSDQKIVDYYGDYDEQVFQKSKTNIFSYMVKENKQLATACNKAILRKLLCERRIYFPIGTISEDVPWIVKLFEESNSIGVINSIAYMYRQEREKSVSSEVNSNKVLQLFDIVKGLSREYKNRTDDFGKVVMPFVAYEYAMVLYLTALAAQTIDTQEIIEYRWLLKYAQDKKTNLVKWSYRLFGFQNTLRLLGLRRRK